MRLSVKTLENTIIPVVANSYEDLIRQRSKFNLPEDSNTFFTCNGLIVNDEQFNLIQDDSIVNVNIELLGGGKKRKKKQYTTPKKIKHKRKPNKLAILKYYRVDSNGKITRLRKECTNDGCGAGIFMGNHFDRLYCGKCHTTYVENKG